MGGRESKGRAREQGDEGLEVALKGKQGQSMKVLLDHVEEFQSLS